MINPKVLISPLVQDPQGRIGEVWSVDPSPYDDETPAAYVVGAGWADWVNLEDLKAVGEAVTLAATA